MHSLPKPLIEFDISYNSCISNKKDPTEEILKQIFPILDNAAKSYDEKATNGIIYELDPIKYDSLSPVTKEDLGNLYTNNMSKTKSRGRFIYDKILVKSKRDKCCFCSYEEPTEIDHFLPKSIFSEFSILPFNLLPVCHRCNKLKSGKFYKDIRKTYIHAYYENYGDITWLKANVTYEIGNAPTVNYYICDQLHKSSPELATRIQFQFNKLELDDRYSQQAATEISEIAHRIRRVFEEGGEDNVKKYLKEDAASKESCNRNSWQSALYNSLYRDGRFCCLNWNL
jgi:hypothetical protein